MGWFYRLAALLVCLAGTLSETTARTCPNGWIKYKHTKCIKFFQDALNQTEAQKSCRSLDSDLVSVRNTVEDIEFLLGFMRKETLTTTLPDAAWLGGMRVKSRWFWLDLSLFNWDRNHFAGTVDPYNLSHVPHPGVVSYAEHNSWPVACLELKSEPEQQRKRGPSGTIIVLDHVIGYKLNIRNCTDVNPYFCQKLLEIPVSQVILVEGNQQKKPSENYPY